MFFKKENSNMEKLLKFVDVTDELSTRSDIEYKIDTIQNDNPTYNKKQIIEAQLAFLESKINEKSLWDHLGLAWLLICSAVALVGNLIEVKSMENNVIEAITWIYFILLLGAMCILFRGIFIQSKIKNQIFLQKILTYLLEDLKENEIITETATVSRSSKKKEDVKEIEGQRQE